MMEWYHEFLIVKVSYCFASVFFWCCCCCFLGKCSILFVSWKTNKIWGLEVGLEPLSVWASPTAVAGSQVVPPCGADSSAFRTSNDAGKTSPSSVKGYVDV